MWAFFAPFTPSFCPAYWTGPDGPDCAIHRPRVRVCSSVGTAGKQTHTGGTAGHRWLNIAEMVVPSCVAPAVRMFFIPPLSQQRPLLLQCARVKLLASRLDTCVPRPMHSMYHIWHGRRSATVSLGLWLLTCINIYSSWPCASWVRQNGAPGTNANPHMRSHNCTAWVLTKLSLSPIV
jgi:hypothetical protein